MVKSVSLYKYRHVMRTFWMKRFSYKRVSGNGKKTQQTSTYKHLTNTNHDNQRHEKN